MNHEMAIPTRPTHAEIRLGALRRNYQKVKDVAGNGVKIMAIVKANAFGHGLCEIASALASEGVDYLGVALLEEAIALRERGIATPILVLGVPNDDQIPFFLSYEIDFTVSSVEKAKTISETARAMHRTARIHLKIDTGMGRIGVDWDAPDSVFDVFYRLPNLDMVGIFSHLATAGDDLAFAREQVRRFRWSVGAVGFRHPLPPLLHMANSAGLINFPEARFTMVRPGIVLYGYEPSPCRRLGVEPVMRLMSKIASVKKVKAGSSVGYGRSWIATEDTYIAAIPIGYGDGYSRSLSNKGEALIRYKKYPIVGMICMDWLMVNLGPNTEIRENDDVLLFGEKDGESIPGERLCRLSGATLSEIPCIVSARVPRIYLDE